jgi:hypothetical protein
LDRGYIVSVEIDRGYIVVVGWFDRGYIEVVGWLDRGYIVSGGVGQVPVASQWTRPCGAGVVVF